MTATLRSGTDGSLALYSRAATSVSGRFATSRLVNVATRGTAERLTYRNTGRGRWAYIVAKLPSGTLDATYNLTLAAPRTPAR